MNQGDIKAVITNNGEIVPIELYQDKKEKQTKVINKQKSENEFYKIIDMNCGTFYFNFYKRVKNTGIEPQYLFRCLYLCSFLDYDGKLRDGRSYIKEDVLGFYLKLSRMEVYNTKKALLDKEIIKVNDKRIVSINKKLFFKGELPKNRRTIMIRMHSNAIRELYELSNPKEHKTIGLMLELLPHIHKGTNVVCHNPEEKDARYLKPMNLKEIMNILGVSKTSIKTLTKLKILDGEEGVFIKGTNPYHSNFYVINPRFMYAGNEGDQGDFEETLKVVRLFRLGNKTDKE